MGTPSSKETTKVVQKNDEPKPADNQRGEGESAQAYNERIPVALQPVQPGPTHTYLGEKYS